MSKAAVKAIVEQAGKLGRDDLADLVSRLQAMASLGGSVKQKNNGKMEWTASEEMYNAIAEAVQQIRGVQIPPLVGFKKSNGWVEFAKAADVADQFINMLERNRVKKVAVRRWCSRLLVNHIIESGLPLEAGAFRWALTNLPDIVDQNFPGYLAAGLMHKVLKSLYSGTTKKPRT